MQSKVQDLEPEISRNATLPVPIDLSLMDVIEWAPAHLLPAERLMLFSLICAFRPACYLEIGTLRGGSALIVAAAMRASQNPGHMVCVDPRPVISHEHWAMVEERATLIKGYSPSVLAEASERAGRLFDFVFIDGDHTAQGVYRDVVGVLPFVAQGAYLVLHDSHYPDVATGIDRAVAKRPGILLDLGSMTREASSEPSDETIHWGGAQVVASGEVIGHTTGLWRPNADRARHVSCRSMHSFRSLGFEMVVL